jgi:acyl-CoA thioester hydrolase
MAAIYRHSHTVQPDEIDRLGHVNNLEYLKWMVAAAVAHSQSVGWAEDRCRAAGGIWVVRSHAVEYLAPAFASQEIMVVTWISDFKKITSLRKYKVLRVADEKLLATGQTNWAFINTKNGMLKRIPQELEDAFGIVPIEAEP